MKKDQFHVFTNLAISMDGKISTKSRDHIDPAPYDAYLMDYHRSRAHAVLVGAGTLRTYKRPALIVRRRFQSLRRLKKMDPHPINVVLARKIDFDPEWPFFTAPGIRRALVVPASAPDSKLAPFQGLAQVFKYEENGLEQEQIIGFLKKLGCRNLLLEGGGGIMFPWTAKDLIDEWNITVCPYVIGGESAPTMVEGEGFDLRGIRHYRLKKNFRRGSQVFLQYRR